MGQEVAIKGVTIFVFSSDFVPRGKEGSRIWFEWNLKIIMRSKREDQIQQSNCSSEFGLHLQAD